MRNAIGGHLFLESSCRLRCISLADGILLNTRIDQQNPRSTPEFQEMMLHQTKLLSRLISLLHTILAGFVT